MERQCRESGMRASMVSECRLRGNRLISCALLGIHSLEEIDQGRSTAQPTYEYGNSSMRPPDTDITCMIKHEE